MISLFNSGIYHWALFLGHISIEKLLKAYFVKEKGKHAPAIHNLYCIAELSDIELTDEFADWLDAITLFNINARYEDYKREFYKQCSKEYAILWIERINDIRIWIKKKL